MTTPIPSAPTLSNSEIINLKDNIEQQIARRTTLKFELENLAVQREALSKELCDIEMGMLIVRQITDIKLGVPLNIHSEPWYQGQRKYCISNVTPSKDNQKNEYYAEFIDNGLLEVALLMRIGTPTKAVATITCPNGKIAQEIALEFVSTGKIPLIDKLLCQFSQKEINHENKGM